MIPSLGMAMFPASRVDFAGPLAVWGTNMAAMKLNHWWTQIPFKKSSTIEIHTHVALVSVELSVRKPQITLTHKAGFPSLDACGFDAIPSSL